MSINRTPIPTNVFMAYILFNIGKPLPPAWINEDAMTPVMFNWATKGTDYVLTCEFPDIAASVSVSLNDWAKENPFSNPNALVDAMKKIRAFHDALPHLFGVEPDYLWFPAGAAKNIEQVGMLGLPGIGEL